MEKANNTPSKPHIRVRFHPDIEGLRAIAVLLVIGHHAAIPGFTGGFIGVDLFFVISGFLITRLLLQEHAQSGHIDLVRFYARRFMRLLPALLAMLMVTGVAAWLLMPAQQQAGQAVAAASAMLWMSNLHFAFQSFDYFSEGAANNLYLHTWSLGVEEQFYLIWPVLILAIGRVTIMQQPRHCMWAGLLAVLAASLAACLFLSLHNAQLAFYLMPTRAWQFATGALVFLLIPDRVASARTNAGGNIGAFAASLLGCTLLLIGLILISPANAYPGAWAMLPTLSTALLIAAGSLSPHALLPRLLGSKVLCFIGRRSYGWYLWHWPVLLLGDQIIHTETLSARLGLLLLSLGLADLSLRAIETPFRHKAVFHRHPSRTVIGALLVMAAGTVLAVFWLGRANERLATSPGLRVSVPSIYAMGCDDWYHSAELVPCPVGNPKAEKTALIIGDSIGLQWYPALEPMVQAGKWRLIVLTKSACPMVDHPIYYERIGRAYTECEQWRHAAFEFTAELRPDLIIMGNTDSSAYSLSEWQSGMFSTLSHLAPTTSKIFVLRPTPRLPFQAPVCLTRRSRLHDWLASRDICSSESSNTRSEEIHRQVVAATGSFGNAQVIDMNDLVCPQGTCRAEIDGQLVFRDNQHLDGDFAASLSKQLMQRMELQKIKL